MIPPTNINPDNVLLIVFAFTKIKWIDSQESILPRADLFAPSRRFSTLPLKTQGHAKGNANYETALPSCFERRKSSCRIAEAAAKTESRFQPWRIQPLPASALPLSAFAPLASFLSVRQRSVTQVFFP